MNNESNLEPEENSQNEELENPNSTQTTPLLTEKSTPENLPSSSSDVTNLPSSGSSEFAPSKSLEGNVSEKKEVKRKDNPEETNFCIFNLCFCFMFPFICRCSQIKNEDMPRPMKKDSSDVVMSKIYKKWRDSFLDYAKRKSEYDEEKKRLEEENDTKKLFVFFFFF